LHAYQITPPTELNLFCGFKASTDASKSHKTLVIFHDGGLVTGNRDILLPPRLTAKMLCRGWILISAHCFLLPQASGAVPLRDLSQLKHWIIANAASQGIDTANIAVTRASAGALMAALAAAH